MMGRKDRIEKTVNLDREKALSTVRNVLDSKYGRCLLDQNTKSDRLHECKMGKINSEIRRMELQLSQQKKRFLRSSHVLHHEPMILVERPPSPEAMKKVLMGPEYYESECPVPRYMRPMRKQTQTPSTLTTIDAFIVVQKKKKNVWEEAMDEIDEPVFRSRVKPSARLTPKESKELQIGWSMHKPKLDIDAAAISVPPNMSAHSSHAKSTTPVKHTPSPKAIEYKPNFEEWSSASDNEDGNAGDDEDDEDFVTPFITQMVSVSTGSVKKKKTKKSVSFTKTSKKKKTVAQPTRRRLLLRETEVTHKL